MEMEEMGGVPNFQRSPHDFMWVSCNFSRISALQGRSTRKNSEEIKDEIVAFEEGLVNNDPEMNEAAKTRDSNK